MLLVIRIFSMLMQFCRLSSQSGLSCIHYTISSTLHETWPAPVQYGIGPVRTRGRLADCTGESVEFQPLLRKHVVKTLVILEKNETSLIELSSEKTVKVSSDRDGFYNGECALWRVWWIRGSVCE